MPVSAALAAAAGLASAAGVGMYDAYKEGKAKQAEFEQNGLSLLFKPALRR
jgi:hypothetical protein